MPKNENLNVAFCPHCGNTAPQKLVYKHELNVVAYDMDGRKDEEDDGLRCAYYVAICSTCNNLILYWGMFDEVQPKNFSRGDIVHPYKNFLEIYVPDAVREAYAEAFRIRETSPNGYAVMLRRALEAVCHDRGVPDGVLQKRLSVLVERGELPSVLAEMTSILRVLGNTGAHHGSTKVTVPMTWGMDEFFRAVIEYVYVAPSKILQFKQSLKRRGVGE